MGGDQKLRDVLLKLEDERLVFDLTSTELQSTRAVPLPLGGGEKKEKDGERRSGGRGAGEGGKETGELPPPPIRNSSLAGPGAPPSQPGEALTGFTRVLVIYSLRSIFFIPIKSVIVIEASADPKLPVEKNPRGHQPHKHPRGKRFQPHPPPPEEKEGTRPGGYAPRSALMYGARGGPVLFSPLGGSSPD